MTDAQQSANEEMKSSMGDKYETGRAMLQQEKDKHSGSLAQARQMLQKLRLIRPDRSSDKVVLGSVVVIDQGYGPMHYFIAISAGRVEVEDQKFYVISPQAPLAQQLINKKIGDKLLFNEREMILLDIY